MMEKRTLISAAVLITVTSLNSHATPIALWEVSAATRFDTSSIVDSNGNTPGGVTAVTNQSLRWGNNAQSGIDINDGTGLVVPTPEPTTPVAGSRTATIATNDVLIDPTHRTATVTHLNNPITGATLSNVDILSTLWLTPVVPPSPGLPPATATFEISFAETPNGANPCADGDGAPFDPVNQNGCSDIFVVSSDALNFSFFYPDPDDPLVNRQYFFSLVEETNGFNPLSDQACSAVGASTGCLGFQTPEEATTPFHFAALITTQRVPFIPEPGTAALVGLALVGLGASRYRKKHLPH